MKRARIAQWGQRAAGGEYSAALHLCFEQAAETQACIPRVRFSIFVAAVLGRVFRAAVIAGGSVLGAPMCTCCVWISSAHEYLLCVNRTHMSVATSGCTPPCMRNGCPLATRYSMRGGVPRVPPAPPPRVRVWAGVHAALLTLIHSVLTLVATRLWSVP